MNGLFGLAIACIAFVGSHFLMSHTLRSAMIRVFGQGRFLLVYSLVSLLLLGWMILAFRATEPGENYWIVGDAHWIISSVLTLVASVLYVGSMSGNPALPSPMADKHAAKKPQGVFLVTRHPMMWSFALWALAHILVAPRAAIFLFMGSLIILALFGSWAQELKKTRVMGVEWESWLRKTSFFPRLHNLASAGVIPWVLGLIIWVLATWAHGWFGIFGAGVFRWV
jgi:uncharacterized membrane protein